MGGSKPTSPRHAGSIDGKPIITYGRNEHSTLEQVRQHLRRHPTYSLLATFGRAARKIANVHGTVVPTVEGHGAPVTMHALAHLSLLAIEASNDHRVARRRLDDAYFGELLDLFIRLPDPIGLSTNAGRGLESLLRAGDHQYIYQAELRHQLPRMLTILVDLWPTIDEARAVDPLADLERMHGFSFSDGVLLGLAFAGGETPYLEPYTGWDAVKPEPLAQAGTLEKRTAFIRWASADYATLRAQSSASSPPTEGYVMYRFNPLRIFPIVRPSVRLEGATAACCLVPLPRMLHERTTIGVFHDLANFHNAGGKENAFRRAFGLVFQAYVGRLLREALDPATVHDEWEYPGAGGMQPTPDWIVIEGRRGVIIEVKQSALFNTTKQWGGLESLRADLSKTLGNGIKQLARLRDDVARGAPGLERLSGVDLQFVVVTFDRVHYANSFVRDELEDLAKSMGMTDVPHAHMMSIEALEYLVAECAGGSLFDLLDEKRRDPGPDRMDVTDWLYLRRAGRPVARNEFLSRRLTAFYESIGLPSPS